MKKKHVNEVWYGHTLSKISRIMKLTLGSCLLLIVQGWAVNSYSQRVVINLNLKNVDIIKVLDEIENQTDYYFLFNYEQIHSDKKIDVNLSNSKIDEALNKILEGTGLNYSIKNRQIVISKYSSGGLNEQFSSSSIQQQKSVSGKVTDSSGSPLPGVSVVVKGTTNGTITDTDGNYSLPNIPENGVLQFSFVGMKSQELAVERKTIINVTLTELNISIDEVVAVGYGTVKKSDLTGSVGLVSKKDIGDRIVTNLGSFIQGKIPGVDVSWDKIRVRGVTTLNNTDPLVVIDGILGEDMSTVNPNDIENIEVLKDASSTAIYGSRGANGVILVTTKSGKAGPLKVNFNAQTGITTASKRLDLLNASQYVDYAIEALTNANFPVTDRLRSNDVRIDRTDWQDAVLRNGPLSEMNIDFSGGSEKSTYFVSAGYKHSEAHYINQSWDVANLRIKNQFNLFDWFKTGESISLSYNYAAGALPKGTLSFWTCLPYLPVKDPNNYWGYGIVDRANDLSDSQNAVAYAKLSHPETNSFQYQANWWAEVKPFKGLVYRIQAGVVGGYSTYTRWNDKFQDATNQTVPADYTESSTYRFSPTIESYLTYSNKIDKHDFSVMVGNTWQNHARSGGIGIYGQGFELSTVKNVFYANNRSILNQNYGQFAYLSYFGRLNYQYNNRYLLTVNLRRDASPRFAPAFRWGTFPSVALAWKMNEEEFIKDLNLFDMLKLRASWGISGNDAIGDFRYLTKVWSNGVYYALGNPSKPVPGSTVSENASQGIKWESTESKTIGIDMGFLKNALTVTTEYFIKNTNDILFTVPRASSLGYGLAGSGDAVVNAASCENKGFELQIGYKNKIGALKYSINANYTNIANKVTSLGLGQPYISDTYNRTEEGYPIGYLYGYIAQGLFMTQAELDAANQSARNAVKAANPGLTADELANTFYQYSTTSAGDVKFKDINGDGIVSDLDRTMIGNPIPKHSYGVNIDLQYKGFDLNAFFQGVAGNDIYYNNYVYLRGMSKTLNQETYVLDRWKSETEPGNGIVPRAIIGDPSGNGRPSSLMVYPGDYLKLKQLSIGYTFNESLVSKIGLSNIRVYASGYNLLCFTKYPFYDPEISSDNLSRAQDNTVYPSGRQMTFGIQVGL